MGSRSRGGDIGGQGKVEVEKKLYFLKSKSRSVFVLLFDTRNVGRRSLGKRAEYGF